MFMPYQHNTGNWVFFDNKNRLKFEAVVELNGQLGCQFVGIAHGL